MKSEKQEITEELAAMVVRLKLMGEVHHATTVEFMVEDLTRAVKRERGAREVEEESEEAFAVG